jgi:hypothetical protein
MNSKGLLPCVLLTATLLASACATRPTAGGGRETVVLGGVVTVATKSFQPTAQTTIPVDTTKLIGLGRPTGARTSVLWGLLTFQDY